MAPRKRKAEGQDEAAEKSKAKVALTPTTRVTRSSSRRAVSGESPAELLKKKKKNNKEKANVKELKEKVKLETERDTKASPEIALESEAELEEKGMENSEGAGATKTIVVEHCKQCNSFKTRATKVKDGLEKAFPGISVRLNPDKPRRGCFEIREEGGEKFISLLDLKRPFKPMKDLDMDKVISDIIDKIK